MNGWARNNWSCLSRSPWLFCSYGIYEVKTLFDVHNFNGDYVQQGSTESNKRHQCDIFMSWVKWPSMRSPGWRNSSAQRLYNTYIHNERNRCQYDKLTDWPWFTLRSLILVYLLHESLPEWLSDWWWRLNRNDPLTMSLICITVWNFINSSSSKQKTKNKNK